jgi:hypothetical protein
MIASATIAVLRDYEHWGERFPDASIDDVIRAFAGLHGFADPDETPDGELQTANNAFRMDCLSDVETTRNWFGYRARGFSAAQLAEPQS